MRVAHLITKLELGGAQRNTLLTVKHLPEYGIEAHLWSGPGGILTPGVGDLPHYAEIPALNREIRPQRDLKAYREIISRLRALGPAILHTHSSKAGFLGRRAACRCRVPVVIHSVHGFPFSPLQPPLQKYLFRLAELRAAHWTDHFIFVSRADRDSALSLGLCENNHSLIRSGFPLTDYRPDPSRREFQRKRFKIPSKAVVIGAVAPFKPQKGLLHLVAVAREICSRDADAVFFLAGDGALRPRLEATIRKFGLEDRFRLPGFLKDLHQVMDMFDCGLSTSLWEGLPQSLVQMRLKSIPLVVSAIPGNMEVVRHGENGFLAHPREVDPFVHYLLSLIRNPELRRRLGGAPENFTEWDAGHMVAAQAALYRRLLENRSRKTGVTDFPSRSVP